MRHSPRNKPGQKQHQSAQLRYHLPYKFAHGQQHHADKQRMRKAAMHKPIADKAQQMFSRPAVIGPHPLEDFRGKPVIVQGANAPAQRLCTAQHARGP